MFSRRVLELRGVPAQSIDQARLESDLLKNPAYSGAKSMFNVFGRGRIELVPKRIVARLGTADKTKDPSQQVLARDGSSFHVVSLPEGLPTLTLAASRQDPIVCLSGGWESERLAFLSAQVLDGLTENDWRINVDSRGVITLAGKARGKVIFGTPHQLEEKLAKVLKALSHEPKLLSQVQELNVSAPGDVVIKP